MNQRAHARSRSCRRRRRRLRRRWRWRWLRRWWIRWRFVLGRRRRIRGWRLWRWRLRCVFRTIPASRTHRRTQPSRLGRADSLFSFTRRWWWLRWRRIRRRWRRIWRRWRRPQCVTSRQPHFRVSEILTPPLPSVYSGPARCRSPRPELGRLQPDQVREELLRVSTHRGTFAGPKP